MTLHTAFTCMDVKLSTNERRASPSGAGHDDWTYVKVSVYKLGVETSWLMVEKPYSGDPSLPIIFRAMREGWKVSLDEDTKTITMYAEEEETLTKANHKLRFENTADFWVLAYEISLSRLREYAMQPVAAANPGVGQTVAGADNVPQQAGGVDTIVVQTEMEY